MKKKKRLISDEVFKFFVLIGAAVVFCWAVYATAEPIDEPKRPQSEITNEGVAEMNYTDDPVADFDRYDAEQQAKLEKLPVCSYCDTHIQDDYLYEINDEVICEECLNQNFRKNVEDFIE